VSRRPTDPALDLASLAHAGQTRKYTGEWYITHPIAVARMVREAGGTEEQIAAAYLHDVVEDTTIGLDEIADTCGRTVASYVSWLTDRSRSYDGNRATRKAIERAVLTLAPTDVQTIKVADLIDNCTTLRQHDPKFAVVYLAEKRLLLDVLTRAEPNLLARARSLLETP